MMFSGWSRFSRMARKRAGSTAGFRGWHERGPGRQREGVFGERQEGLGRYLVGLHVGPGEMLAQPGGLPQVLVLDAAREHWQ